MNIEKTSRELDSQKFSFVPSEEWALNGRFPERLETDRYMKPGDDYRQRRLRINCSPSLFGQPTPEGLHRDGHDFISMHLMNRVNVDGGTSRICSNDGQRLMTVTLRNRMDGFLVNDRALRHGVSQITPSTTDSGHRDMLIIDYNRAE